MLNEIINIYRYYRQKFGAILQEVRSFSEHEAGLGEALEEGMVPEARRGGKLGSNDREDIR